MTSLFMVLSSRQLVCPMTAPAPVVRFLFLVQAVAQTGQELVLTLKQMSYLFLVQTAPFILLWEHCQKMNLIFVFIAWPIEVFQGRAACLCSNRLTLPSQPTTWIEAKFYGKCQMVTVWLEWKTVLRLRE